MIKQMLQKLFHSMKIQISKGQKQIINQRPNPIHAWKDDAEFQFFFNHVKEKTLISEDRLFVLYQFVKNALRLEGDMAELGVYKGGSAKLIIETLRSKNSKKTLYLFDTFSGMPATIKEKDLHKEGDYSDTSLASVKSFFENYPSVIFKKGLFLNTFSDISNNMFSLIHVDCDIYQSVKLCCEFFYPRLVSGGFAIFDDYGFRTCPGAKDAVDEFFKERPETPIYLPTGQCLIIKK